MSVGTLKRQDAAKALRQLADNIEANQDEQLVKLTINVYCVPDDGSVDAQPTSEKRE